MMREHNRIAGELKRLNKHWSDEQLFQNARRIVTAINQHVTYNEWLPRVLGWNAVNLYGLNLLPEGYYEGGCLLSARKGREGTGLLCRGKGGTGLAN